MSLPMDSALDCCETCKSAVTVRGPGHRRMSLKSPPLDAQGGLAFRTLLRILGTF